MRSAQEDDVLQVQDAIPVTSLSGMIGGARAMQPVYRLAWLLAPRDTAVLITGPTGSGKEIAARALHSDRRLGCPSGG